MEIEDVIREKVKRKDKGASYTILRNVGPILKS